ncbi:MAG: aldo/keto reductase [Alphaproteobacteria bacterium]|nr:aldo/keto reductase [Alphaproteobacteria bacterium]
MAAQSTLPRRKLGNSGLQPTVVALGTAPLAGLFTDVEPAEAVATIQRAWDAGIRTFDTAPYYGFGKGEHYLGAALREILRNASRDDFILSTKAGRLLKPIPPRGPLSLPPGLVHGAAQSWANPLDFDCVYDYSYDGIMRSYDDSLQRLGLSSIDILLIHDIGRMTHHSQHRQHWQALVEGGFKALRQLRDSGAVKAIGLGVNEAQPIIEALEEIDLDCALLAGRFTLLEQESALELLKVCEQRNLALLVGGVFNSGILACSRDDLETKGHYNYQKASPEIIEKCKQIHDLAEGIDLDPKSLALLFPLTSPQVATVVIGARSVQELKQNIAAMTVTIDRQLWKSIIQNLGIPVNLPRVIPTKIGL